MNKKKLPRAVTWTADEMRAGTTLAGATEWQEVSARRTTANELFTGRASVPNSSPVDNVIDMAPKPSASMPLHATASSAVALTSIKIDIAARQSLAHAIVERHANYSAVGGLIPLPVVNVASITAIIVRMVKVLSNLYDVPFERDRARAIVIGLVGGTMPTGLATVTASTLFYIVPGSNLLGLAVSSIAASACTRRIGRIFVEQFEGGATLAEFPVIDGR